MNLLGILHILILWLLAIFFLVAGVAHFTPLRKLYEAIVPKALPNPVAIVQITGVLEVLGGLGLLAPFATRLTGIGLILFLVAVFPANVEAARQHVRFSNPLWVRTVAQIVLIGLTAWATLIFT